MKRQLLLPLSRKCSGMVLLLLVYSICAFGQSDTVRLHVVDFGGEERVLTLTPDSIYLVVFINANCCNNCLVQIVEDIHKNAGPPSNIDIVFVLGVGDDGVLRRELMNKIGDDLRMDVFLDAVDDESMGIDNNDNIKENLKKYAINRTPAVLLVQNGAEQVFQNNTLFDENGELQWSLLKMVK